MSNDLKFSIIIPAFNEEVYIKSFLIKLKELLENIEGNYEIIVVDDGSSDNTFLTASTVTDIRIVRHPYNKGNGAAVKTGIKEAQGEIIIIIDADGQHDPKHIPEMIEILHEYDLVVGARDSFGIGRRGFGNALVSKLASYLSGVPIPDLTSGYRAFRKDKILEFISLLPNGFSLPSTSTLAFATSGHNITFINIEAYTRQGGESSIKVLKDGMKFIILIVRMISLFKPLKVFAPASVALLIFGGLWSLRAYLMTKIVSSLGAMIVLAGIFVFLFGLMADQIAETRLLMGKILKSQDRQKNKPSG